MRTSCLTAHPCVDRSLLLLRYVLEIDAWTHISQRTIDSISMKPQRCEEDYATSPLTKSVCFSSCSQMQCENPYPRASSLDSKHSWTKNQQTCTKNQLCLHFRPHCSSSSQWNGSRKLERRSLSCCSSKLNARIVHRMQCFQMRHIPDRSSKKLRSRFHA